mmetsp:Transcript_51508/g.130906  ORF Transcript_51508/g.130906 Transcript_51508/m.130906 type:complete len:346 (+) Transcript_51508:49-1086(+)
MGQGSSYGRLLVLQQEGQLHLKNAQLSKEVSDRLRTWQEDGAPLGLSSEMFGALLGLQGGSDLATSVFRSFDTDSNQKVDAFEVLSASIMLASGSLEDKIEALFSIFDFSGTGRLNFDEVNILLASFCRGLSKVCGTPAQTDTDIVQATRQSFDCHNLPYDKQITKEQLKRWIRHDVEAASILDNFHKASSTSELEERFSAMEQQQAEIFQKASEGAADASLDALVAGGAFKQSLGNPSDDVFRGVLKLMVNADNTTITASRFVAVARAWNAFEVLDASQRRELPPEDVPTLKWLCQAERQGFPEGLAGAPLQELCKSMNLPSEGSISWSQWVSCASDASPPFGT